MTTKLETAARRSPPTDAATNMTAPRKSENAGRYHHLALLLRAVDMEDLLDGRPEESGECNGEWE